jgi:putative Holliday junction resolvase
MRILGLDIGDVRIGVAISDPLRIIAQGMQFVKRTSIKDDVEAIKRIMDDNEVSEIVVGLPKTLNGEIGVQAQKVLDFVEILRAAIKVPILLYDERLTTVAANKTLIEANMSRKKRKKVVDKISAVFILQGYLDSHI